METKQREAAIKIAARLMNQKDQIKQQIENLLEQVYTPALMGRVKFDGIEISANLLKSVIGEDVFAQIESDAKKLSDFIEQL